LDKLREYADKKGKEDLKDQAIGDSQSLKTYLDQIKYDRTFKYYNNNIYCDVVNL
jgi:hypothetical protein